MAVLCPPLGIFTELIEMRTHRYALLAFLLALAVRLAFVAWLFPSTSWESVGYGSELGQIAENIAEGRGFSSPFNKGYEPTAWLSPLVPIVWGMVFSVVGVFSRLSLLTLMATQAFLSSLSCAVYVYIAARMWRKCGVEKSGMLLVIAIVFALWPSSVEMVRILWYFTWQELACACLFLSTIVWVDRTNIRASVTLGVVAGVTGLINPVPLVLPSGVVLWVLARKGKSVRSPLFFASVAALIGVLICSPWAIRNGIQMGSFIPFRSSLWVEVRQGNNVDEGVKQTSASLHPALCLVERDRYRSMGEISYVNEVRRRTTEFVRFHPKVTIQRVAMRAYVYWFTDIADVWPWQARPKWWLSGGRAVAMRLVRIGSRLVPLCFVCLLAGLGWLNRLPFKACLAVLFIFLPMPYYLTHVRYTYSYQVQPYVLLSVLMGLSLFRLRVLGGRCRTKEENGVSKRARTWKVE